MEPSAVFGWEDGVVVRSFPVPQPCLEDNVFCGTCKDISIEDEVEHGAAGRADEQCEEEDPVESGSL